VVLRVRYGERNSSKVEEFISAISTFKLVEKIPDPDVVTGMAMLLEGDTAEWWRGVKANVQSFDDVVRMLRESFCPPKPRALFAQLPNCPAESDQLDVILCMLHSQICERLFRHKVKTFDVLLIDAGEAEKVLSERSTVNIEVDNVTSGPEGGHKQFPFAVKKDIRSAKAEICVLLMQAKTSVASTNLKKIMGFDSIMCNILLADGTYCERKCLMITCKIVIGGRCLNIQFLIFPEEKSNRTLIGSDFMEEAGIVLNMGQRYWYFKNCPTQQLAFSES
ncbi:hypothetical protein CVS40_9878, partial [Lucilia cuprina]